MWEACSDETYKLLCLCWGEGLMAQDMRDANIVILYNNARSEETSVQATPPVVGRGLDASKHA